MQFKKVVSVARWGWSKNKSQMSIRSRRKRNLVFLFAVSRGPVVRFTKEERVMHAVRGC